MSKGTSTCLLFPLTLLPPFLLCRFEEVFSGLQLQVDLYRTCEHTSLNLQQHETTRTFRGSCAGGNGVYTFFSGLMALMGSRPAAARSAFFASSRSFLRAVFSELLRCLRRNLGKKAVPRFIREFRVLGQFAFDHQFLFHIINCFLITPFR
jgi:hypothetical protein